MPGFGLRGYGNLLDALKEAGYAFATVSHLREPTAGPVAFLRHDLDFFLPDADLAFARAEAERGICATYYVLLSGIANPLTQDGPAVLAEIADLGHEVGLHYDLEVYPSDEAAARHRLDLEAELIETVTSVSVRSICTHNPYRGGSDPFLELDEYVHASDPRVEEVLYLSDSCRAFRDESLLRCFSAEPPPRVMLLTHPESWLDEGIEDRIAYLETVLLPEVVKPIRRFVADDVAPVWRDHPGARAHDSRTASRPTQTG